MVRADDLLLGLDPVLRRVSGLEAARLGAIIGGLTDCLGERVVKRRLAQCLGLLYYPEDLMPVAAAVFRRPFDRAVLLAPAAAPRLARRPRQR